MDMMFTLKNDYPRFSASEKLVADYLMANYRNIQDMSIHEMASACQVSASTISRFVHKVFVMSFSSSKVELAKHVAQRNLNQVSEMLSWADDINEIPLKIINEMVTTCNDVLNSNGAQTIETVIDMIDKAEHVYFIAIGTSSMAAIDFQHKLAKVGVRANYHFDGHLNIVNAKLATENDLAIAFSFSGKTKEVNMAVKNAKMGGAKVVAITNHPDTNLAKLADVSLFIPSIDTGGIRLASIFSRYGNMFLIDVLFMGVAKRRIKDTKEFVDTYHTSLNELREK